MVRNLDLAAWDEKAVSIQDLSPGSMPRRMSVLSVKVEDNTGVQDLNSSNYSINLPEVYPIKSIKSTNDSGKYVLCKRLDYLVHNSGRFETFGGS